MLFWCFFFSVSTNQTRLNAIKSNNHCFTEWIACFFSASEDLKQKHSSILAHLHCFCFPPSPHKFCWALTVYSRFDSASICRSHETRNCSSIHLVNSLFKNQLCGTISWIRQIHARFLNTSLIHFLLFCRTGDDKGDRWWFIRWVSFSSLMWKSWRHQFVTSLL